MNLEILQVAEDAFKYGYVVALRHFPKCERFTLVADIKREMVQIITLIIRANKSRETRTAHLRDLDTELDVLRSYVRMSLPTHRLPRKRNVRRMRRRIRTLCKMLCSHKITKESVMQVWASFLGYMKHCDGHKTKVEIWREMNGILRRKKQCKYKRIKFFTLQPGP